MTFARVFKHAVLRILKLAGFFRLGRFLTRRGLMIVCWHGVSLDNEQERFADLFISVGSFRKRLEFLSKHYTVIDLDEAVRQHRAGRFRPRQVVLTFDDGYYNFAARAAPLLGEFGMTATVYLNTRLMDDQEPAANLLLRDVALLASDQDVRLDGLNLPQPFLIASRMDRARLTRLLMNEYESLPPDNPARLSFVVGVAAALGVDVNRLILSRTWHRMNVDEVREMDRRGFSIEPHGHRHLNVVDHPHETEQDVRACRERIRELTGKPAVHFCYPSARWNRQAWTSLQHAGIETATTLEEGPNYPQTPLLALRRISNGESRNQLEFEFEMSNLKYLLRCLFRPAERYLPQEKVRASKTLEQKALAR
ncbi:MAG: polysaccharide deacetylase family protein [Planctomycetaceae bacterium]